VWGKDLLQIQNRFRKMRQLMKPEMAAFIAAKLCEGLDYAHKKKDAAGKPLHIIHRDISPQNILISYEGELKIIDFGIAKAASRSSKTQAGVLKGKFGYMSPEQVRGLPLDRRSAVHRQQRLRDARAGAQRGRAAALPGQPERAAAARADHPARALARGRR